MHITVELDYGRVDRRRSTKAEIQRQQQMSSRHRSLLPGLGAAGVSTRVSATRRESVARAFRNSVPIAHAYHGKDPRPERNLPEAVDGETSPPLTSASGQRRGQDHDAAGRSPGLTAAIRRRRQPAPVTSEDESLHPLQAQRFARGIAIVEGRGVFARMTAGEPEMGKCLHPQRQGGTPPRCRDGLRSVSTPGKSVNAIGRMTMSGGDKQMLAMAGR